MTRDQAGVEIVATAGAVADDDLELLALVEIGNGISIGDAGAGKDHQQACEHASHL